MNNVKLSIIIPIYNAENELSKAVNSVLSQTERAIEVILVDDGSKDKSAAICDEFATKDDRVKVLRKKNGGVSSARNTGIKAAVGEYIGFVDSDDWIEPRMFERMLSKAMETASDLVMCDATTVYSNGQTAIDTVSQLSSSAILKKADFTPELLLEMAGSVWRCIYKNQRYNVNQKQIFPLYFPLGIKFSEDRIFNIYAMGIANQICYIKEAYYNRFVNMKSTVHRFHADYFEACKLAANEVSKAIKQVWNDSAEMQTAYLRQFISGSLMAINNYYYKASTFSAEEKKVAVKKICDDVQLRNAIVRYGTDQRSQWILDRNCFMLIVYAKLANWRHGR